MSNHTNTEFVVTSCPACGVTVAPDERSFRAYVEIAREMGDYEYDGVSPWLCCPEAVIDPNGLMAV